MDNVEIIRKYIAGEMSLERANAELKGIRLDPCRNVLTEQDMRETTAGDCPAQANGWGLLDTGTGSLDKVRIENGRLVNCDMGEAFATVFIGGKTYQVKGAVLV